MRNPLSLLFGFSGQPRDKASDRDPEETPADRRFKKEYARILKFLTISLICGAASILIFSFGVTIVEARSGSELSCSAEACWSDFAGRLLALVGVGALIALAAMAPTGFLGFLFGTERISDQSALRQQAASIPASIDANKAVDQNITNYGSQTTAPRGAKQTNLDQISDWLTKILLGAGLTQIHAVSGTFGDVASAAAAAGFSFRAQDSTTVSSFPAGCVIVYFGVVSFVWAYMATKMHLPMALDAAELAGAAQRISTADAKKLEALHDQSSGSRRKVPDQDSKQMADRSVSSRSSPEQLQAALRIRSIPLSDLTEFSDLVAVARANTIGHDRNRQKAIDAFRLALAISPSSYEIQEELAWQYSQKGRNFRAAQAMLAGALTAQNIGDIAAYKRFLSEAINYALYSPAPDGFTLALHGLSQFKEGEILGDKTGELLGYRICANGQKFATLAGTVESNNEKRQLLESVERDIRLVLEIDPSWREFLHSLWNEEAKRDDPRDIDLVAMHKDPVAFERLQPLLAIS